MTGLARAVVVAALAAAACGRPDPDADLASAQSLLAAGDYARSYAAWERVLAARPGDPGALFALGLFHRQGWGRPADPHTACDWFERAAAARVPLAEHYFAEALAEGVLRPPDPARAAVYFESAASAGHLLSWVSLGDLHAEGRGVARDRARAFALYFEAARGGVAEGELRVGRMLRDGDGVTRDASAAYGWLASAARHGDADAALEAAELAVARTAPPAPAAETREFFERAASAGRLAAYVPAGRLRLADRDATGAVPAESLAKAYLWLTAALRRLPEGPELDAARTLHRDVLARMPATWQPDLDREVAVHVERTTSRAARSPGPRPGPASAPAGR